MAGTCIYSSQPGKRCPAANDLQRCARTNCATGEPRETDHDAVFAPPAAEISPYLSLPRAENVDCGANTEAAFLGKKAKKRR
ncbi:MAG: hypothetical protein RBR03_09075 [Desulfuromonas thiophila]|jgi:hypothetical protein|nr:hypothetical protein [Desulfuromonas thiophila]MDY0398797.1 hypothetical protein [Desulfuromonas thiophila]